MSALGWFIFAAIAWLTVVLLILLAWHDHQEFVGTAHKEVLHEGASMRDAGDVVASLHLVLDEPDPIPPAARRVFDLDAARDRHPAQTFTTEEPA